MVSLSTDGFQSLRGVVEREIIVAAARALLHDHPLRDHHAAGVQREGLERIGLTFDGGQGSSATSTQVRS